MGQKSFSVWLAHRFYKSNSNEHNGRATRLAVTIATAGVALGLAIMIVSVCVVKGFQREVAYKLCGFSSHITLLNDSSFYSPESYPLKSDSSFLTELSNKKGILHVQRVSQKMGILKTHDAYQTILLNGIAQDYDTAFLSRHLVEGYIPAYTDTVSTNSLLISKNLAETLDLKLGNSVYAYFFNDNIRTRKFNVVGIYNTYMPQFDNHIVFTDFRTVNKLNQWGQNQSSRLEIFLNDFDDLDPVQYDLARFIAQQNRTHNSSIAQCSVKENPQTASAFSWLEVLNMNILVIMALMMGVAGFTMISGLLILILERTNTIGVLKSMGATNWRIRKVFVVYSLLIVVRGMLIGNLLGLGFVGLQWWLGLVKLDPEAYYVSVAPVSFDIGWIVGINVVTFVVTILSLILPSALISRIETAKVIQFD